jgi:hypothetical protein
MKSFIDDSEAGSDLDDQRDFSDQPRGAGLALRSLKNSILRQHEGVACFLSLKISICVSNEVL